MRRARRGARSTAVQYDLQGKDMTVLSAIRGTAGFLGETIAANPGFAGGATAMCVAMTFFTANAVYFQEQRHPAALFATRPAPVVETQLPQSEAPTAETAVNLPQAPDTKLFAEPEPMPKRVSEVIPEVAPVPTIRPSSDGPSISQEDKSPQVAGIQELLAKMGYYDGAVDGLMGPMTGAAIETYKDKAGLRGIELSEAELITSLRNNLGVTAAIPDSRPEPRAPNASEIVAELIANTSGAGGQAALPAQIPSMEVVKVQAALRAFGNTDIAVDGISGTQTEVAIREFQALFHLPVTGEIDGTLLDKMRAIGLIK